MWHTVCVGASKPLHWVGSSLKDVRGFPEDVRAEAGYGLYLAQLGGKHPSARPLRGFGGAGVLEIAVNVAGYSSATHACEIDEKIGQLALHAVEGARFDSEWENQKEPFYVGNDKQVAEAKSGDALARIRELLPELKMDNAEAALAIFFDLEDADPGAAVTDALADVRHFCDRHGLCFGDLDRTAYEHYLEELSGVFTRKWGVRLG